MTYQSFQHPHNQGFVVIPPSTPHIGIQGSG